MHFAGIPFPGALPYKGGMKRLHPTPEERAALLVRKLEDAIRQGRTAGGGMSFRAWQEVARVEIANAIRDAQSRETKDETFIRRVILGATVSFVTIGFWGAVVAVDRSTGKTALAVLVGVMGVLALIATEWGLRSAVRRGKARARSQAFQRIEALERQIKQLERQREKKLEELKKDSLPFA